MAGSVLADRRFQPLPGAFSSGVQDVVVGSVCHPHYDFTNERSLRVVAEDWLWGR